MSQPKQSVPGPSNPIAAPLVFPDRLYGRAGELAALMRTFTEVGTGAGRVLLLPGHSGSGKTALVQSLRHPVQKKNGYFLEGKFNQYQQGIPLFSLRQALHQLARELRAADPAEQQRRKAEILEAVGGLGRLLTELVPEWEAILGPQPPVAEISPYEAPHRFALMLRQFLGVFCLAEHPVVLFIDDWQWADAASLTVLQHLQVATSLRYLLLIAAYRDDEVAPTHPFMAAVEELRRQAVPVATLPVLDLSLADIRSLVNDTLTPATEDLDRLSSFLHATTRGNPFFLRALLESLHARRALWFEPARGYWRWDGRPLVAHDGAEDVVQLFVENLSQLPAECRHMLSVAACLGNCFDLEALALVSGLSPSACHRQLRQALEQRVILPLTGERSQFQFQHDRVQQAAHTLIPRAQLPATRLKIARVLLERLPAPRLEERLLEVADHYNAGRALVEDETEQRRLAELNIAAGRKARKATAYQAALQFHRVVGELLARPVFAAAFWSERHGQTLQFYKDWAESEFLEGRRPQAEDCIREALAHAQTPLETADILCVLILQNTLLARYPDAIAAGRQALAGLGITLPESDFEAARDAEIAQVRRRLAGRAIASLRDVPPMSDPIMLMATRVLITLGPPCYRSHQRLWSVLVPKVVNLTLQYGPVPQIGYSHTAFGGLLGWVDNDYATAKEFGELAGSLMREVFTSPADQSVFYLMVGSSTRHWFTHLRAASEDYALAWETGLRSGNLQYAAYAFGHSMYCRFYQGVPLGRLIEESRQSLAFSRSRTNQWAIDLLEGGLQIFGALAGREISATWQEAKYLQEVDAHQNIQVACIYRVFKAFSLLVLGDAERALAASDEAEPLIYTVGMQGLLPWPEHMFTRLLILAALYPQAAPERRAAWRTEMDRVVARLEVWATHAPENYCFKLAMARAEITSLENRTGEALELYEQAAEAAHTGHFTQWEAWAHERAAQLALACGDDNLAHGYWQNAYFAYHRWGALAKVALLEQDFLSKTTDKGQEKIAVCAQRERYIRQLRTQADRPAMAASPLDESALLKELAKAAEHLREEVAHRKEVEAELQQHRDQLTQEIAARTKDLETSRELARKSDAQTKQLATQQQGLLEAQDAMLNLVEDATASRERTEQINRALRESEFRRSFALEAGQMGTWDIDVVSGKVALDSTHEKLCGYPPGTFPGTYEAFNSCVHPDDLPEVQRVGDQSKQSRNPFQSEFRVIWPDGSVHWVSSLGQSLFNDEGRPHRMVGVTFDITARKQAEAAAAREALRTEFMLALHQHAPQLSDKGLYDYVLDQAVRLTDSAIGFFHLVAKDQRTIILTTWNQEALKNCTANYDTHYPLNEAGNWVDCVREQRPVIYNDFAQSPHQRGLPAGHAPVRRFMSIPVIQDGKVHIIFGVGNKATDYTAEDQAQLQVVANEMHKIMVQRAAQSQLVVSEERFRTLVEQAPEGIFIQTQKRFAYVNAVLVRLLGATGPEQLLGELVEDRIHPDLRAQVRERIRQLNEQRLPQPPLDEVFLQLDGTPRNVSVSAVPFEFKGELGAMVFVRDITERKRAEEALRAGNDRLQQTLAELKSTQNQIVQQERIRALGTMASGIAHDFNNLLVSILGISELFIHQPEILQDKEQTKSLLPILHTAAKDAREVVRRLREFYRDRDTGESYAPVSLAEIIGEAISLSQPRWKNQAQAGGATITITTDCPSNAPSVEGNAAELREALINLIFNAVDAMPHGGDITIRARTEAGTPILEVADTGTGMTEEVQRRCLEPFYTTKGTHGSGLGLPMVYGTMTRHRGHIAITSTPGVGTTVRLSFPQLKTTPAGRRAGKKETKIPGLRILLVDDLPDVRLIVSTMLASDRHLVETAVEANEAIDKLSKNTFDVLITDRSMPGLSGDHLAVAAKKAHRHLKVIMLTGFGELMQATGEHPPDVDLLLSKPVELAELRAALLSLYSKPKR